LSILSALLVVCAAIYYLDAGDTAAMVGALLTLCFFLPVHDYALISSLKSCRPFCTDTAKCLRRLSCRYSQPDSMDSSMNILLSVT